MTKRRDFFKYTAAAAVVGSIHALPKIVFSDEMPLTLGMASYTLRKFSLPDCLKMTARLGLNKIAFKSFHLPLESSRDEILAAVKMVKEAGLDLYGAGVIYMQNEKQVDQAFAYCQAAGVQVMIGVPNHELLDLVEEKAKSFDLIVAIHNHGPGDALYPSPESVYRLIEHRDRRLGLCLDVGHTQRIQLDPAVEFEKYHDRIYDLHIKDVSESSPAGNTVEIGRGVIDIPKLIRVLIKYHYQGIVSLEYEKDEDDPLPGAAESIGYLRGVLRNM
ncbi:MAG: sugar phosphate isomerase/epimerase [Calditrichaeota bacterium]|nr:MAG: sugar phosphate isomerase/epimerase [Calditrichota bacterium]